MDDEDSAPVPQKVERSPRSPIARRRSRRCGRSRVRMGLAKHIGTDAPGVFIVADAHWHTCVDKCAFVGSETRQY